MILVTGATGNVGSEVVEALRARGVPVRALVRDHDRAGAKPGVQYAAGDLNDPQSLAGALAGVRAMFLLPGYEYAAETLRRAARAGVERVVLLSSVAADGGERGNAVTRLMMDSEAAVRGSGLSWTFLRPNGFMSNALRWAGQVRTGDVVALPFAGVPIAAIDPADIAAAAAAVLTGDGHDGQAYALSGPAPLLPADQVRMVGDALGRTLRFEPQSDADARAAMSGSMPPEYVDAQFRFYADGTIDESRVYPAVRELTGRAPGGFDRWARAHADAFR
jgi:uncharacterized protein YbjT (DUF2867 family)